MDEILLTVLIDTSVLIIELLWACMISKFVKRRMLKYVLFERAVPLVKNGIVIRMHVSWIH